MTDTTRPGEGYGLDLATLQAEHAVWVRRNFPDATADQAFLGVVEEVGELAHARLKRSQGIRGTEAEHTEAERDAVGDVLIYMLHYATLRGWDLSEILAETWEQVRQRDWVAYPGDGVGR